MIVCPPAQGSHAPKDGPGDPNVADGMQGLQAAPRNNRPQHLQPSVPIVNVRIAVRINSFFIILFSNRNLLLSSQSYCHVNSTSRFVMCKRNGRVFLKRAGLQFCRTSDRKEPTIVLAASAPSNWGGIWRRGSSGESPSAAWNCATGRRGGKVSAKHILAVLALETW